MVLWRTNDLTDCGHDHDVGIDVVQMAQDVFIIQQNGVRFLIVGDGDFHLREIFVAVTVLDREPRAKRRLGDTQYRCQVGRNTTRLVPRVPATRRRRTRRASRVRTAVGQRPKRIHSVTARYARNL